MKSCVVLLVAAAVSMFTLADSLKCYSCPDGSAEPCDKEVQCSAAESTCLKLTSDKGKTYSRCIQYADCDFEKLATMFPGVSKFKSRCCQTDLCNSAHSTAASPLIGLLVGLAALCWGMH